MVASGALSARSVLLVSAVLLVACDSDVNLGRTSIASVSASSVNGKREMDNVFYGIVNAFDDGKNVRNGIPYTYWLPEPDDTECSVEVLFSRPVEIRSISVDGSRRNMPGMLPSFLEQPVLLEWSGSLELADGSTVDLANVDGARQFAPRIRRVTRVSFSFAQLVQKSELKVHEIRIMGRGAPRWEGAQLPAVHWREQGDPGRGAGSGETAR